jgi:hypothetical protein
VLGPHPPSLVGGVRACAGSGSGYAAGIVCWVGGEEEKGGIAGEKPLPVVASPMPCFGPLKNKPLDSPNMVSPAVQAHGANGFPVGAIWMRKPLSTTRKHPGSAHRTERSSTRKFARVGRATGRFPSKAFGRAARRNGKNCESSGVLAECTGLGVVLIVNVPYGPLTAD